MLKVVKIKNDYLKKGEEFFNSVLVQMKQQSLDIARTDDILTNVKTTDEYKEEFDNDFIGINPVDYCKNMYGNAEFKKYVESCFVIKKCQLTMSIIKIIIFILALGIGLLTYFLSKNIILTVVVAVILLIIVLFLYSFLFKGDGEDYNKFYKRTYYQLIFGILGKDFTCSYLEKDSTYNSELRSFVKFDFDIVKASEKKQFKSSYCNGSLYNLVLQQKHQHKNSNGQTTTSTETVLDGFNLDLIYLKPYNTLGDIVIKIREDENILSSLTEDTVNSMIHNDKDFMFDSEELNKSFDCTIDYKVGDADQIMLNMHKIITPIFERTLLFLRERYNSFNLTITDNGINFNVNMQKGLFQKIKGKELLDFTTKYKDKNKIVKLPTTSLFGIEDFTYYNTFPIIEQMYFVKYIDYFIKVTLNKEYYLQENIEQLVKYQQKDIDLANMEYKEFKKIYENEIKELYKKSEELKRNWKEVK